jgi:hypothetical protein
VIVLEDSASMVLADGQSGQTRWERARQLATALDSLTRRRSEPVRVTLLRGNGVEPLRPLALDTVTAPPLSVGSDHHALLAEVASRWAERPLRALILMGDGNDTAVMRTRSDREVNLGVAAFLAVGVGDPQGPADRTIQNLRYPDIAFEGDEVVVEVAVSERFTEKTSDRRVHVTLRSGQELVVETTVDSDPGQGITRLELPFVPSKPGLQVYELEIAPLANERYLSNNKATIAITVRKERARLLLLTGRPSWDSRFLARAAHSEDRLELALVYAGHRGLVFADSGTVWVPPRDVAAWRQWDALILTGWQDVRQQLSWPQLREAVAAGLGLVVLGEDSPARSAPRSRTAFAPPPEPLAAVLPVKLETVRWLDGEWIMQPAPSAGHHPLLEGVTHHHLPGYMRDLVKLPPLTRVLQTTTLPGSVTLLSARPRLAGSQGREVPLLVLGHHGAGHVAWFGGRRLWELAFWEAPAGQREAGDQPARRLLRNLLVWAVVPKEDVGLALVGHRRVYQEGERIRLEAHWRDMRGLPVTDRPLALRLQPLDPDAGFAARLFSMDPIPGGEGRAVAVLPLLPPGRYSVRPQAAAGASLEGREDHLVVSPISLEAAQVRQDSRHLRQLAAQLGGSYLAGDEDETSAKLSQFLAAVTWDGDVHVIRNQWDIWAGWPLLVLVVILLSGEWYLRRRHGLL